MEYAHKREVFTGKLIDQGVIRNKFGQMARYVEAQQAWIESIVYQLDNMTKAEGDRLLGGTTALAKANCGLVSIAALCTCAKLISSLGRRACRQGGCTDSR